METMIYIFKIITITKISAAWLQKSSNLESLTVVLIPWINFKIWQRITDISNQGECCTYKDSIPNPSWYARVSKVVMTAHQSIISFCIESVHKGTLKKDLEVNLDVFQSQQYLLPLMLFCYSILCPRLIDSYCS